MLTLDVKCDPDGCTLLFLAGTVQHVQHVQNVIIRENLAWTRRPYSKTCTEFDDEALLNKYVHGKNLIF